MPVVTPDILVCYLTVFVDDEYGSRCEAVAEEVEDVVCLRHRVVFGGVEHREVDADLLGDAFCTR